MQLNHIDRILLADTMSPILGLNHDTRRPYLLSEYDSLRLGESQACAGCSDAQERNPGHVTALEPVHHVHALFARHTAVDPHEVEFDSILFELSHHPVLDCVHHRLVVRKNYEFRNVFDYVVGDFELDLVQHVFFDVIADTLLFGQRCLPVLLHNGQAHTVV